MEYVYCIFLTLFVSFCSLKYFDIFIDKKRILWCLAVAVCTCAGNDFHFHYFILLAIRDICIYGMITNSVSKDRNIEIIAMILLLETIAKCSYYGFILIVPLIFHISIADAVLYHDVEVKIMTLLITSILLIKYGRSSSFLKVRCDTITYALVAGCSLISLYGLDMIPWLGHQLEEYQLYFLLLSFVYVVIFNIMIYIYHNRQTQKEMTSQIALEQLHILQQEKAMISVQRKMIDNIKHDLNYFQAMVNAEAKKQISETVRKIDEYHQQFLFNDYLFNNFIYRMKSEMKENQKDLKIIITNTHISIDLNMYNQLIAVMKYVIDHSIQPYIQFSIQNFEEMRVFEFTYIPDQKQHQVPALFADNKNIVFSQTDHQYVICSVIREGGLS